MVATGILVWFSFISFIAGNITIMSLLFRFGRRWVSRMVQEELEPLLTNDGETIVHYAHCAQDAAIAAKQAAIEAKEAAVEVKEIILTKFGPIV